MMNFRNSPLLLIYFFYFQQGVFADIFTLNNGESIEGSIIRENETQYVLEIQVTATIKDEKIIQKADVKSIVKPSLDKEAFEELKDLVPTPDLLSEDAYIKRVNKVEEFVKSFPASEKLIVAKEILDTLRAELSEIQDGAIKLSGEFIAADDYEANAIKYDSMIAAMAIKNEVNRRNFIGALRLFSDFDSKFSDTEVRAELVPIIKQVLHAFGDSLQKNLDGVDYQMRKREKGLAQMAPSDRLKTERAINERAELLNARFMQEKSINTSWVTPDVNHKESLIEALRQVENETKRLATLSKSTLENTSFEIIYRKTWHALKGATDLEQKKLMDIVKQSRMPEPYLSKLLKRASEAAKARQLQLDKDAEEAERAKLAKEAELEKAAEEAEKLKEEQ